MDKPYITQSDVLRNILSATCNNIVADIMNDVNKREGFDTNKNNAHLLSDNERFIFDLFDILSDITACISSIENACIFMTHFYKKNDFEKHQISLIDYNLYHYDVLCYKISTLKDLYFKLVNFLYELKLEGRSCNWKAIEKREDIINNPNLFHFLRENYNYLSNIDNKRNKSAHEGKIEHEAFKDISPYVYLSMLTKTKFANTNDDFTTTCRFYSEVELNKSQQFFLDEVEIYRYNAFVFTRCILCSLSEKFIQTINCKTKSKYSEIIKKTKKQILKNMIERSCNIETCSHWE